MRIPKAVLALSTSLAGCMVGDVPESDPALDATTLQRVQTYQEIQKVNTRTYPSTLGDFDINCYVAGDTADYARIHPDTSGSNITVAPGTVIVREVLDAGGGVEKLTVMAKGPPGYDPSLGDWWFGVTDPSGTPLVNDAGQQLIGRLAQCHQCHAERASDDFLFGVPSALE